ncbi:MAG: MFS transporter [Candidatus Marinimicrobia bacterium]|nr:MFS transporter [Candidatus Neomarinimicrobiota bacterium]
MVNLTPKKLKQNLFYNCIHEFSWGLGIAFHSTYAVIPLFLKKLGAPDAVIISIAGLFSILLAFPMLFSAALGRNIRNIKKAVIVSHTIVLPPVLIAGFIFAFFAPTGPYAWVYYYVCFIFYSLALGVIIPIWTEFLSHVFPRANRGHYLGISFAFNSVGGFIGGIFVKILLTSSVAFPNNFGWGFIIMGCSILAGTLVFLLFNVDTKPADTPHKTIADFWKDTKAIIQTHKNFRYYLFSRIFITAHFPAMSLYAVYTQDLFGFDISQAGVFTVLQVITFGIGSVSSGKIGDRWGHKTAITLSFCGYLMAIICTIFASSMFYVYAIFLCLGLGHGGFMPSAMNMVYEFADTRDSKIYMALIDTFLAPFILLMVVMASFLNPLIGTRNLFMVLGALMFVGLILLTFWVKEPHHRPYKVNG